MPVLPEEYGRLGPSNILESRCRLGLNKAKIKKANLRAEEFQAL